MFIPVCPFPNTHWLVRCMQGDCILHRHEQYVKQTLRNRFDVLAANGRVALTINVAGQKGNKVTMNNLQLTDEDWRKKIIATLISAYSRAAFFEHYMPQIQQVLSADFNSLADFNMATIRWQLTQVQQPIPSISESHKSFATMTHDEKQWTSSLEPAHNWPQLPAYPQVFMDRHPFQSNLSGIDLLMNLGPRAVDYLLLIKNG
ncbi:MAG: WbqC family protein [Flavobacteriales bacterium]